MCDKKNVQQKNCKQKKIVILSDASKLKLWQNSNCDKNQTVTTLILTKHKLWQNYIVKKLILWLNSNLGTIQLCQISDCSKTKILTKLNLRQNSNHDKAQIVTQIKFEQKSNWDKTVKTKIVNKTWNGEKTHIVKDF